MTHKPITLDQEVPKPGEALSQSKVSEVNVQIERAMLEERKRRLDPILPFMTRWRLSRRARKLHKLLNQADWNALCQERGELWALYVEKRERCITLRDQYKATDKENAEERKRLYDLFRRTKASLLKIVERGKALQAEIARCQSAADEYAAAVRALDGHLLAVNFRREEAQNHKAFYREARDLETIMRLAFRNDSRLHYVGTDRRGREYRVVPRFQRISIDTDIIWFQFAASLRTMFGWQFLLPRNVSAPDLWSDETLANLSIATGRQVQAVKGTSGVSLFLTVNRLDSPDGLPLFVPYKRVLEHYPSEKHELLPFPVGVKAGRKTHWRTFGELPHMLLAGSSQSGKSNEINCIISTLISMNSPQECRLLLIDLKGGIELSHFENMPHLVPAFNVEVDGKPHIVPAMIKEVDDLVPALEVISALMRKRFDRLTATKTKEIVEYNGVVSQERRMARIVLVFDEMATFLGRGKITERIHNELREITGKGRAVGIHTILCNQYTNVDAIPGYIKANLAIRMSGAMPSGSASMTVLDSHSAKELPRIPGRMIEQVGSVETIVQTAYISSDEIAEAVEHAREFGDAPPLDVFMEVDETPEPEPAPIELTERERAILEVLATVPVDQTISVRKIAEKVLLPLATTQRALTKLAEKGCVGKISGSNAITEQGRAALARFTLVPELVSSPSGDVSNVSTPAQLPDDQPPVLETFSTNGHSDPAPVEDLEALGLMDLMSEYGLDAQEIMKEYA